MSIRAGFLAVLTLLFTGACVASAPQPSPPWKVVTIEGVVQVSDGEDAFTPVAAEDVLAIGSVLTTGAESRAELTNGLQKITVSPNSRLRIPEDRRDGVTRVLQEVGRMLFEVDHQDRPHFEVLTPLATAVVKGTTFEVRVTPTATNVEVKNGLVEVRIVDGDAHKDVPTGFEARVVQNLPKDVVVYRVVQAANAAGAADLRGRNMTGSSGAAVDGSNGPIALPSLAAGAALAPGAATAIVGNAEPGRVSVETIEVGAGGAALKGKQHEPEADAKPEKGRASGQSAMPVSKPVDGLASVAQVQRASKNSQKNSADDAWAVAKYGAMFVGAWIIFVPIVALLRRSSLKRKSGAGQKRASR